MIGDGLCRFQIHFQMERGQGENIADVIESVSNVVAGEIATEITLEEEEVLDDVVVFGAIEAADRRICGLILSGEGAGEPLNHAFSVGKRRVSAFGGRHDLASNVLNDFVKFFGIGSDFSGSRKIPQIHSGGGFFAAMARETVFFKKVVYFFVELFVQGLGFVWGLRDGGLRGEGRGSEAEYCRGEECGR